MRCGLYVRGPRRGGTTIVVSGTGADKVYPRSSEDARARQNVWCRHFSSNPGALPALHLFHAAPHHRRKALTEHGHL